MDRKRLGRRIKAFRKLKGYTQISFAKEIGVSIAVLGQVERGTKDADDELLTKIVNTLAISWGELMLEEKVQEGDF
ncbi:helix-turn-helix domain-containing protein [Virgibacillus dakarensis]|uniref:Transcriptional regulator n=1 Tax=Lentibacillus populi TaxID=1827502 RepID=A0A9W5TZH8_9BACI|nr:MULTISPECIES: helix-turn-helix transcriptional regulator [Bacillaceae]MBT2218178.1 helix-turn-helix transcriptional regulator [Virgibacillus dakarensis]MTW86542.1 helix-turn-helix domain-containing protein [Virgibacillus dakarensis]GGB51316.1 transcriptional regulator [Lentibacillus populi]